MSNDTAVVNFAGNDKGLLPLIQELQKKNDKLEQGYMRLKKSARDAADTTIQSNRGAKQAIEQSVTATERYLRTMAGLRTELDAGRITQERYNAARAAAQSSFKAANPASIAAAAKSAKDEADKIAAAEKKRAEALRQSDAAQQESNEALKAGAAIFARTRTEVEKYAAELQHLNELKRLGAIDADTHGRAKATLDSNSPEAQQRTADAIKAKTEATRAADEAQQHWNDSLREAERISEQFATAEEQHGKEIQKLNQLRKDGAIDGLNYTRAMFAADERLKEATKDTKALAEAERQEAKDSSAAATITDRNKTAKQRYTENVSLAKRALDQGKISLETYNAELKHQAKLIEVAPSSFAMWTASIFTAQAAYGLLKGAIQGVISHQKQLLDQAAEVGKKFDENFRKWQIQSGQTSLQGKKSQESILGIAKEIGSKPEEAQIAATQLVSSGFSPEEASGPALRNLMMLHRATGGEAPTNELALSMASYLQSQGLEKSGANILKVGVGLRNITAQSQFKLQQFPDFAKEAATFKDRLTIPEQLAAGAALTDVGMPAAEAGTALRSLVVRGSTENTEKKQAALRKIGLKEKDVDFVGEDLDTVLGRLSGGLNKLPEEKRDSVLKTLFEERAIAPIKVLMQDRAKLKQYASGFNDVAGFNAAVNVGTSGVEAGVNRLSTDRQLESMRRFGTDEAVRAENRGRLFDQHPIGGILSSVSSTLESASSVFDSSNETKLGIQRNVAKAGGMFFAGDQTERVAEAMKGVQEAITQQTAKMIELDTKARAEPPKMPGPNAVHPALGGQPR